MTEDKTMNHENKRNAIAYVRADIDMLCEQTEDSERRAFHNRAHGGLFAIRAGGLITDAELHVIAQELDAANTKACGQVRARR
ncbi:hypothetical protein [Pseudomonas sp. MWU16-30317]|uniref:hypothetical protein n=1 Tax=Pseudomonas sp. MWU16-30317 TaxID=2878095 RepID=UPI001CFAB2D6|nr:hypothetical protein [Pseudomonas sp. MWU16-30317]